MLTFPETSFIIFSYFHMPYAEERLLWRKEKHRPTACQTTSVQIVLVASLYFRLWTGLVEGFDSYIL